MNQLLFLSQDKTLSPRLAAQLFTLLQSRSHDAEQYLFGTKIFSGELAQGRTLIAPAQLNQFIRNAQKCQDPDLAFLLAHQLLLSPDPLAQLLQHAHSPKQAWHWLQQFHLLWQIPVELRPHHQGNALYLDIVSYHPQPDIAHFYTQLTCSALSFWLRQHQIKGLWHLPSAYQGALGQWQRYLGLGLQMGSAFPHLTISSSDIGRPPSDACASQQQWLQVCQLELERLPQGRPLLFECRRQLKKSPSLQLEQLAQQFGLSTSTLKRRLKKEGTSFQKLQDDSHRESALRLSLDLGWNNVQMASYFGISDVNNFRRAFKRWTGLNPSEIKQSHSI